MKCGELPAACFIYRNSLYHLNEITKDNQGRHKAVQLIFEMKRQSGIEIEINLP